MWGGGAGGWSRDISSMKANRKSVKILPFNLRNGGNYGAAPKHRKEPEHLCKSGT